MISSKHGHQPCQENEIFPYIKHELYSVNFGDDPAFVFVHTEKERFWRSETFIVRRARPDAWQCRPLKYKSIDLLLDLFASDSGQNKTASWLFYFRWATIQL